jgi:hypothetical protein
LFVALIGATVAIKEGVLPGSIVNEELLRLTPVTFTKGATYTVIRHVATFAPSAVVAVIVVVPAATAVTRPELFTVAIGPDVGVQFTVVLVAFAGYIVGTNVIVPAVGKNTDLLSSPIPVTETAATTVTTQEAVKFPFVVVAVIVAEPVVTPVTLPFVATVAFAEFDDQTNALFVAFVGKTVATKVTPLLGPVAMVAVVLLNVTPVTGIKADTVTTQEAVFAPSAV